MTHWADAVGASSTTTSIVRCSRAFSRGGVPACTELAISASFFSSSAFGRGSNVVFVMFFCCQHIGHQERGSRIPPIVFTFAICGWFLNHTGWGNPPQGKASCVSIEPGMTASCPVARCHGL